MATSTEYKVKVMEASRKGEIIECRKLTANPSAWHVLTGPMWDWYHCDYRVKSVPKLQCIRMDELPPIVYVRGGALGNWHIVVEYTSNTLVVRPYGNNQIVNITLQENCVKGYEWSPDRKVVKSFMVPDNDQLLP